MLFLLIWELSLRNEPQLVFYFGLPSKILSYLYSKTMDGTLIWDFFTTFYETAIGFIVGNVAGTVIGLSLWFSKTAFNIAKPYIVVLGSAPIFALAPLMIVWFGTGVFSKIMMATFSTIFIALFQAYSGASDVQKKHLDLMKSYGATKMQVFRKIVAPSSIVWVMSAFKMNVGFALLGAFIGEYISSNQGLGHLILVASGLFDISLVLTGIFLMVLIALIMNICISYLEKPLRNFIIKTL